jgi:hypothetical protein
MSLWSRERFSTHQMVKNVRTKAGRNSTMVRSTKAIDQSHEHRTHGILSARYERDCPMPGNTDGLRVLNNITQAPNLQIRYLVNSDAGVIRTVNQGFLVLVAFWSGPSLRGFSALTKALKGVKTKDFQLVALDVDGLCDVDQLTEMCSAFGNRCFGTNGAGEVAYCQNGRIVRTAVLGSGTFTREIEANAREFVSSCGFTPGALPG